MVTIVQKNKHEQFYRIRIGEFFRLDDSIYLKYYDGYAFNFSQKITQGFAKDCMVEPVDVEITVK